MSLIWGGAFDIFGEWELNGEHSFHRVGVSVDIDNDGFKEQDPEHPKDKKKKRLTQKGRDLEGIMTDFGGKIYPEPPIHFGFEKGN
jgi:hypothetical protein